MLKIRMQRTGRKNEPQFRIVVGEHTIGPKSGKFLEKLGSYNPKTKEKTLDTERAKYWMEKGAGLSDTMHNLFVEMGVTKGKKINVLPKKTVPEKPAEEAPAEEVAAAPAAEESAPEAAPVAEETPTEETPAETPAPEEKAEA